MEYTTKKVKMARPKAHRAVLQLQAQVKVPLEILRILAMERQPLRILHCIITKKLKGKKY